MRLDRVRALTAAEQYGCLGANPISEGHGILRPGRLTWKFQAEPTPLSRRYALHLSYRQGGAPHVIVLDPDLNALADGRTIPHVYSQKPGAVELCVYLPRTREWDPSMRIDQTIVPWAIVWLFYFEEWLASNDWKGGGEHPRSRRGRH
jgi:hypothetical protein